MPRRSDATYFKARAEVSRAAAAGSKVRSAIFVHRQMAVEYDRRSRKAEANDAAAIAAGAAAPDVDDAHGSTPNVVERRDDEDSHSREIAGYPRPQS